MDLAWWVRVKNNHVNEINTKASTYSDPITLDYLLEFFEDSFLNNYYSGEKVFLHNK